MLAKLCSKITSHKNVIKNTYFNTMIKITEYSHTFI